MTGYDGESQPDRGEIDRLAGPTLLEFGSPTCGHCLRAQPAIATAIADHPRVRHLKIADGRGLPLGRSFGVKLWPTLVFLSDGVEVSRLVRPLESAPIASELKRIAG
ncbi:MAG: thioredoxin family protein [Gammaproteobacteria bacterium]